MPEEKSGIVSFRLTAEEYKEAERFAAITSRAGKVPNNSVASLAKACLFTRLNEWTNIEAMQKLIEEKEAALKSRNVPAEGYAYL